jgi:uncharacterized protein (TIGR00299 family) protein
MKIAYCDCFSGISGDMFLGALLDAGLPLETLRGELARLDLPEKYALSFGPTMKGAISASLVDIKIEGEGEAPHSHSSPPHPENSAAASKPPLKLILNPGGSAHPHPHEPGHAHAHLHESGGEQDSHAPHTHQPGAGHVHQRSMRDISTLISESSLSPGVKANSLAIFQKLAQAEGKIHGQPPEDVHFHEVGAVDSILDIVGAVVGLEVLGIERLYASALPLGTGHATSQHGLLPLPAPATLELMRMAQVPVVPSPAQKEMVTPTGAAILATLATFEQPAMRITGVGTGAGRRDLPWPNILRLIVGETGSSSSHGDLVLMETNIDDMAAQGFGQVMGRLFAAGALDVFFTPIFMKKNRPATMLSVITPRQHEPAMARILLEETTTFGMRVQPIGRYEAQREMCKVQTIYGEIDLKLKILDGKPAQAIPEYDTCLRLAEELHVPFIQVYQAALAAGRGYLSQ